MKVDKVFDMCSNGEKPVLRFVGLGNCKVLDGYAAGGAWILLQVMDGKYLGKKLWCEAWPGDSFVVYRSHCDDDGFLFNGNPDIAVLDAQSEVGGDFVPELNGRLFRIEKEKV